MSGTKPVPIPWILCDLARPSLSTGESFGSTATVKERFSMSICICPLSVYQSQMHSLNLSGTVPHDVDV